MSGNCPCILRSPVRKLKYMDKCDVSITCNGTLSVQALFRMKYVILSDDLTGASGVASLINAPDTITIDLDRIDLLESAHASFISVNLDCRNSPDSGKIVETALEHFSGSRVALRIDSTLRGNISAMLAPFLSRGKKILLTDTIPEYGRYTMNGKTTFNGQETDILSSVLKGSMIKPPAGSIEVADSRSYGDIRGLAYRCLSEGLIPVDPGPMIAEVLREGDKLGFWDS